MAEEDRFRHLFLENISTVEDYTSPSQGLRRPLVPPRQRARHGANLRNQLQGIEQLWEQESEEVEGAVLRLEFESFPNVELAIESLDRGRSGIELLNVRREGRRTLATVFVPEGKLRVFEKLVSDYLERRTDVNGRPRDNRALIDAISEIRKATVRALWTDDPQLFPARENEAIWWEVWLSARGGAAAQLGEFRARAADQGITVAEGEIVFPERVVVLASGTARQMKASVVTLERIAELRRPKETAEFFDSLIPEEQATVVAELARRMRVAREGQAAPHVSILDTGVTRAHPLLRQSLARGDMHTVEPGWGYEDQVGHGTGMASLALLGDLTAAFQSAGPVFVSHRLESTKLLNQNGGNGNDPAHHGYLTTEAVSRPEVAQPARKRIFFLAITAKDNRDRGKPSSWSAALDRLASDADGDGGNPRLFVISAGNEDENDTWASYPEALDTSSIHDPAQAWNALTIGAFTELVSISENDAEEFVPVAPEGCPSPFTTTSLVWQSRWPLKPDVVLEGGNAGKDSLSAVTMASLSLLAANHQPDVRLLTTMTGTSASAAIAAGLGAQIMAEYPECRPETVRGLIVHSAQWTDEMKSRFLPENPTKNDYAKLTRICGFGVPSLDRAMWSLRDSLTLIAEGALTPFMRQGLNTPRLREMHVLAFPWPKETLEDLADTPVEMRVTLSYFIEPNPSARGAASRYRYESHGLRFDVKRPEESLTQFRHRVNRAAREEEEGAGIPTEADNGWLLGKQQRHRGSLHSDIWRGSAAALASREYLAVYPSLGWWKLRPKLERYDKQAPYTVIVSISTPEIEVDLYTEVAAQIGIEVEVRR